MPVIDETKHTMEIKNFRKELQDQIDELKKRLDALTKGK